MSSELCIAALTAITRYFSNVASLQLCFSVCNVLANDRNWKYCTKRSPVSIRNSYHEAVMPSGAVRAFSWQVYECLIFHASFFRKTPVGHSVSQSNSCDRSIARSLEAYKIAVTEQDQFKILKWMREKGGKWMSLNSQLARNDVSLFSRMPVSQSNWQVATALAMARAASRDASFGWR